MIAQAKIVVTTCARSNGLNFENDSGEGMG